MAGGSGSQTRRRTSSLLSSEKWSMPSSVPAHSSEASVGAPGKHRGSSGEVCASLLRSADGRRSRLRSQGSLHALCCVLSASAYVDASCASAQHARTHAVLGLG